MKALAFILLALTAHAAEIPGVVRFGVHLRTWDGFGVNYVETAQTRDYTADPQDYGGFSLLTDQDRARVLDLTFGPEGLRPGLLKMFLDPFHEPENDNADPHSIEMSRFDHTTTTEWMRYFAREGQARTRKSGSGLTILTTLYGPPAWTTKQRIVRGRDLDPRMREEVAEYMTSWVKYLREQERLPVRYISLHNEGEDWVRWPADGGAEKLSHDYNMLWPLEQVTDFLALMRDMLDRQGLKDVGVTPGETSNWYRFHEWGYAGAIARDPAAARTIGLITSHGFVGFSPGRWFGDWRSAGTDLIREKRPGLHAWNTSQSWGSRDVDAHVVKQGHFLNVIRGNIYSAKVNGIIPWAAIQRPAKWAGGDPNAGKLFGVDEQGKLTVEPAYYYYKQVSRAGQPGMAVADVSCLDTEVGLIAFSRNATAHPDAFVVLNMAGAPRQLTLRIEGSAAGKFAAWRTSAEERYIPLGETPVTGGVLRYTVPPGTATTFYATR